MSKIFRIYNPIEDKSFVGITKDSVKSAVHSRFIYNTNLRNALKKYGYKAFVIEELADSGRGIKGKAAVKRYIKKYNALSPSGYNSHKGRQGGKIGHFRSKIINLMDSNSMNMNNLVK